MPSEPNVSRLLLRMELADGQVREFEAQDPCGVELTVTRSDMFRDVDITLPPSYMPASEATQVTIVFKASQRLAGPFAPITIRTHDAGEERCVTCGSSSAFWQPQHRPAI